MRVHVDGETFEGRAVSLPSTLDVDAVVAAVFDESASIRVDCPRPGPVHEYVASLTPDSAFDRRGALATLARSRGATAPQDATIESLRDDLADDALPTVDRREARRRVADAGGEESSLVERVAELRGTLKAHRAADLPTEPLEAELADAVTQLSELSTERIAAEQRLASVERRASADRERRERRFERQDRLDNLRRRAREHLAASVYDEFATAVKVVPGEGHAGDSPGSFDGDPVTAALAVVRLASLDAPIVLSLDRFDSAEAAARQLDTPVIWL